MPELKKKIRDEKHAKLKELILYISARNVSNSRFGAIKLNKILFYSDIQAYFELGKSITGEEYFKLPLGPAPRKMKPILNEMKASDEISFVYHQYAVGTQERVAPIRKSNLSLFSPEEIAIVEQVIQWLWNETADEVSNRTHKFVAWKKVKERETVPFETAAFVCHPDDVVVTDEAIKRAKRFAAS